MVDVGLPLADRTNYPSGGAGGTAGGPGTTPEGPTLTPGANTAGAPTPTLSDTVDNETPQLESKPTTVSAAFGPPKPKPNKRKKKEAEKMIPPTRREELLIKDCGKLMQRSVDTAINKAKAGLERELTVFLERELTAFHREIYPVLDSNQNQLINRLDNTLDRHLDTANEHTMDIVSGKHPLMTEKMKALRMENEALKEKLQKYVDQD